MTTLEIMQAARAAAPTLATKTTEEKNGALHAMADALLEAEGDILAANARDLAAAEGNVPTVMLDRLRLDHTRLAAMADGIRAVAGLADPIGHTVARTERPDRCRRRRHRLAF